MQYRLVALFAVSVTAVPVILTGGSNAILPGSEEDLISNLGVSANALSNGDSTGIKNAKRADDVNVGPLEAGIPVADASGVLKRTEDISVGPISIRR